MSRRRRVKDKKIEQYEHRDAERLNNPPVGLVTPELDPEEEKTEYCYDPHLDPQLVWAGKAERTSFEVDTVSLHVHEKFDPKTVIKAVLKKQGPQQIGLVDFFSKESENPPLRDAVQFYNHSHGWSNRLISGDSLLVMNSLLEKEGMAGKVQMIFMDPPYGIKYGSNFQPFVNKRSVKDGNDEDLTQEPEMIKAFRDTWELGIHSYLSYLRDRLLLSRELLTESGSFFIQISDENIHHVKELLDEVFGVKNFQCIIGFRKTTGKGSALLDSTFDFLLWYSKGEPKFRQPLMKRSYKDDYNLRWVEWPNGKRERLSNIHDMEQAEKQGARVFRPNPLTSQTPSVTTSFEYEFNGKTFSPGRRGWSTNFEGMERLKEKNRLLAQGNTLSYIRYLDDFPYKSVNNIWDDTRLSGFGEPKLFVVQTSPRVIARCILMTTDPGDLVFDPTCGSGTTAYVAEQYGRRWITCDTSRVAITLARQRLLTSMFPYYSLVSSKIGLTSGFINKKVPYVTLKSIARNDPPIQIEIFDEPDIDNLKTRVTGPFTVEAVPSVYVKPLDDDSIVSDVGESITREGETIRQSDWRDELLKTGIRGKAGQKIEFTRIEALSGTMWLHADAETKESKPKRAVISFGPKYSQLDHKQVELAIAEAQKLWPRPDLIIFVSFQFDSEAAKDIDETNWPGVTLLKVQMNIDLLTEDLKKNRASNESFWLIGQPDVNLIKLSEDSYRIDVQGFDYYNVVTNEIESGGPEKIAMWMLDTDYDYRSLFPRQVFFPMAGKRDGWSRLARILKSQIDEDLVDKYGGTVSLPFSIGENKSVAIKIIDDRGIESLKIIKVV